VPSGFWPGASFGPFLRIKADNAVVDGDRDFFVHLTTPTPDAWVGRNDRLHVIIRNNDTIAGPTKGFTGIPGVLAPLADGRLLVAAATTPEFLDGERVDPLIRVNADLSRDRGFKVEMSPGAIVDQVVLLPGGKIAVAGNFTEVGGTSRPGLARLESNGSLDAGFDPGIGWDAHPEAVPLAPFTALAVQSDGKLLAGCHRRALNGVILPHCVRLLPTGDPDPDFLPNSSPLDMQLLGEIYGLAQDSEGRIVFSGSFWCCRPGPGQGSHLLRLTKDGTLDSTFDSSATILGFPNGRMIPDSDGGIWLGVWTGFGAPTDGLFHLKGDGSIDPAFAPRFTTGAKILGMSASQALVVATRDDGIVDVSLQGFVTPRPFNYSLTYPSYPAVMSDGSVITSGVWPNRDGTRALLHLAPDGSPVSDQRIERLVVDGTGQAALTFIGQPGLDHVLEVSEDLHTWRPILTNSLPQPLTTAGFLSTFSDPEPPADRERYYRLRPASPEAN
jgi:uncharacterized delta-60 repeat protein